MNQAEILTLLKSKVKPNVIRVSIMAGKLSGILRTADMTIAKAQQFSDGADWVELIRVMEGTLEDKVDHLADDNFARPTKGRSKF